jgi:MFS family permease
MNQKIKLINPLIAPCLSLAFIVFSSAPFLTYISIKLQVDGFTETLIGIVQSGFYLGYLIGSLRAEKIIRRVGFIRSFVCFAALFGATILIQGLYISIILWTLMRIIAGISMAALYVIIESWFLSSSDLKTRGRILSIYMIIVYGSQSFSQLLIQYVDLKTLTAFLFFGILCYLSIIPVSINYSKTPDTTTDIIKKSVKEVYKSAPLSFWGSFISGMILSAIYSFLPIFAQVKNFSVSYIMTITIAGGFLLQWPIGLLSDIFDRRKVLIINSLFLIIPSFFMIFFSEHIFLSYIFCFFLGGFSFVIYPISITQACEKFDTKYIPFVVGIMSLLYGIGATIGPFVTSFYMEWFTSGVFLFIAMTSLILVIIGSYIRIKFPTIIPKEEKGEFMPISASAPIVTEMASKTTIESKKEISSEKKLENENNSPNQQG